MQVLTSLAVQHLINCHGCCLISNIQYKLTINYMYISMHTIDKIATYIKKSNVYTHVLPVL